MTATVAQRGVACGGTAALSVSASGVELAEPHAGETHAGHAHYHVYFDDGEDPLVAAWSATCDVPIPVGAPAASHDLHVVLMDDQHEPIAGVDHAVAVVDVGDAPCVGTTMVDPSTPAGGQLAVEVAVNNFTLRAPGGANAPGTGHYHFYLDAGTTPLTTGYSPTLDVPIPAGTSRGTHELHVVLMNNDHTPVENAAHGVSTITVE